MHKSVLTVLKKNRISMFDGLLEIFGTSQNQGEYHTNHPQPCHMWIFLSIHFGRSNYAKQIQRQPPRTAQTTKGKKTAQSPSPFSSQWLKPHLPDVFSSNCPLLTTTPWDQNLGTFPQTASNLYRFILVMDQLTCQVPTGSSEICVCIYKCVYIMCVWVCLKIMDFPKTV